jgi:hypothetical protein
MNLQSLDNVDRLYVGGYLYTKGAQTLYQVGADLAATSNRFANATIDEIRYYRNEIAPATSPNRYSAAGGTFEGRIGLPAGGTPGTVSYTVSYPSTWRDQPLQTEPSVILSHATDAVPGWVAGPGTKYGEGGTAVADPTMTPTEFRYQLQFTPGLATPSGAAVVTPVVDDVTLTVLRTQVVYWCESME